MINNTSLPLIFLGTNTNIHWYVDIATRIGYDVAGIIDDDYHGQGSYKDLPMIATQQDLVQNKDKFKQFQFFCTVNWQPDNLREPLHTRNRQKRLELIDLINTLNLNCATIVSKNAEVSSYKVHIGKGAFIDSFCIISPEDTIGDYSFVHSHVNIGNGTRIGKNCVIQRHAQIAGNVSVGDRVYMGFNSVATKNGMHIADDTVVHPSITVLRDTLPGEVVSLAGKDLRKVYSNVIES
jgi:acetyltransferase-like isoleucine patch superfamily enzyme